jgi:site-specific recombinase XerD
MTEAPVSPLRRRMIEDMTMRKFAPRTQEGYIRAVKGFSAFLGASPDRASFEDLRRYHLHLVASGTGTPTINHTVTALRFLFRVTLRRPQVVARLPFIREPRKLPVVLSPQEVAPMARTQGAVHHRLCPQRHHSPGPTRSRRRAARQALHLRRTRPEGPPGIGRVGEQGHLRRGELT